METPNAPSDKISQLRALFVRQLPTRVVEIRRLFQALEADSAADGVALSLHRSLHSIKGTGASFGFREWATLAAEGEDRVKAIFDDRTAATGENWRRLAACIHSLEQLVTRIDSPQPSTQALPLATNLAAGKTTQGNGRKVLVVDDERMMRRLMVALLQGLGHTIVGEAADGEAAIRLCLSLSPDLVLMDVNMPGIDGVQALDAIHSVNPGLRAILASATSSDELEAVAARPGCRFISKPIDLEELRQAIVALE